MVIALVSCAALFWLFCMFTTGTLARMNGQSYGLWLIIGLLTGPIGLIFAWIFFKFSGERHRRIRYGVGHTYDIPEIIQCPNCGQSVPSGFHACQFCGASLHGRRR
jgi:hypothetical protein